jgi:membrane protein YdbS with pleckstrin-like domain
MLYALFRDSLLALLRAPSGPPPAPAGSHASVRIFRASPRYLSYRLLILRMLTGLAILIAVAGLAGSLIAGEPGVAVTVGATSLFVFPTLFLAGFLVRVDYDLRYYVASDRSLRVREGAWTVREMTITYANVQNLRVVQGPLMRAFGISDLRVDVAGGGRSGPEKTRSAGHHVNVAGVENAHELRDLVLAHQRAGSSGAGLGDPEDGARTVPGSGGFSARALQALEGVARAAEELTRAARALPDRGRLG